jgi:hypothetical protein
MPVPLPTREDDAAADAAEAGELAAAAADRDAGAAAPAHQQPVDLTGYPDRGRVRAMAAAEASAHEAAAAGSRPRLPLARQAATPRS